MSETTETTSQQAASQSPPPVQPASSSPSSASVEAGKTTAIIAYLTVIGLIIALVLNMEKKNSYAAYHIRQSLGVMLTGLVISFVSWIPILGWIVAIVGWLLMVYMWLMGLLNALNGRERPVPILGTRYLDWLKGV